jgi:S1-C subfamily serine protease
MKKAPLYSRSRRSAPTPTEPAATATAAATPGRMHRLRGFAVRHERRLWAALVLLLLIGAFTWRQGHPSIAPLTPEQIDALVRKSIEEKPLPSAVSKAYQTVIPSVVRVVGLLSEGDDGSDSKPGPKPADKPAAVPKAGESKVAIAKPGEPKAPEPRERGVGTGVVIIDNGTILTNLHVVAGAKRIQVTFADGLESEARLINVMPEHDLAVLRAQRIPDDLIAATMRGTGDLSPGDHVLAVGFPFGIGPSASAGVVSGLKREFRSPEGERVLTNLIQFDAAANPGNSGGPLVTMEGEVVGIVTAILNPTKQRVFVGIGFAVPIENAAAGAGLPPF